MHYRFILLLLCLSTAGAAQDAILSQFYAAPLRLNPALTGISTAPRAMVNYRSQHTAYPGAYTTLAASVEAPLERTPSSFGLRLLTDRQLEGLYTNSEVALTYSYEVRVSEELFARLGLGAGFLTTRVDFGGLRFGDAITAGNTTGGGTQEQLVSASKTSFDFAAGILVYYNIFYFGTTVEHLNRPDESLVELNENLYAGRPQRVNLHGGAQIPVKRFSNRRRPVYVAPNFLFAQQAAFRQLNLGTYLGYGDYAIGGWYRHAFGNADAVILALNFRHDVLRVGLSYDSVLSNLRFVPGGLGPTFEVSMGVDFGASKKLQRRRFRERYRDCFRMFQ